MKAIEILSESRKIDEAPSGVLGNIGRRVGAGVLKSVGLNTWAKGLDDKADIGTFANRYYREFQSYVKGLGKTEDAATFADLKTFLDQNKIPSGRVPKDTNGTADAAMVNAILNRTATDFLKGTTTTSTSGTTAEPVQQTAQTQSAPVQRSAPVQNTQMATNTGVAQTSSTDIASILKAVSRMKKADLQQLDQAVKAAMAKPSRTKPAAAVPQTPAQIRSEKQKAAGAAAQAQMAANPAPVVPPQDTVDQTRATKQAAAAANAQAQMATNPAPGPKVWKNNRAPYDKATSKPAKPKKVVAV